MNREIEFRAWNEDGKRFVRVVTLDFVGPDEYIVGYRTIGGQLRHMKSKRIYQYTGLNDRDNQKIFEGDIVEFELDYETPSKSIRVVTHSIDNARQYEKQKGLAHEDDFLSCWGGRDKQGYFRAFMWIDRPYRYAKVIGNIHENRELLND